jgi:hypothetical protein
MASCMYNILENRRLVNGKCIEYLHSIGGNVESYGFSDPSIMLQDFVYGGSILVMAVKVKC